MDEFLKQNFTFLDLQDEKYKENRFLTKLQKKTSNPCIYIDGFVERLTYWSKHNIWFCYITKKEYTTLQEFLQNKLQSLKYNKLIYCDGKKYSILCTNLFESLEDMEIENITKQIGNITVNCNTCIIYNK